MNSRRRMGGWCPRDSVSQITPRTSYIFREASPPPCDPPPGEDIRRSEFGAGNGGFGESADFSRKIGEIFWRLGVDTVGAPHLASPRGYTQGEGSEGWKRAAGRAQIRRGITKEFRAVPFLFARFLVQRIQSCPGFFCALKNSELSRFFVAVFLWPLLSMSL